MHGKDCSLPELKTDERVECKIKEYKKKGSSRFRTYFAAQILITFLGALIPILATMKLGSNYELITAVFGATIASITGYLALTKYPEAHRVYKMGQLLLEQERIYYHKQVDSYADAQTRDSIYVKRVEEIVGDTETARLKRFE
jgi:Protein of unknown function (DUF4231)